MFTLIYKRRNKYMKKIIATIAVVLCLCVLFVGCGDKNESETDFKKEPQQISPNLKEVYNKYCYNARWAKLAEDRSYLYIDTNPKNEDSYVEREAWQAILSINSFLGLPGYLSEDMKSTTSSMGRQEEVFEEKGIKVTWYFHPKRGLEVTYKLIVN